MNRVKLLLFSLFFGFQSYAQTLTIKPGPVVTICSGDTVTFTASTGFVRYSWNTGAFTQSIRAYKAGVYTVTATDRSSKQHTAKVELKVNTPIAPKIGSSPSSRSICKGDSIVLEIGNHKAFSTILWENKDTTHRTVIRPTTSGSTWLITKDTNGCEKKTYIQFTVKNCSSGSGCDVIGAWPDAVLCGDKDSVILEAKSGYSEYLWNDGNKDRIRTIRKAGTYILKVKDRSGNYCYDTIEVHKGSIPSVTIKTIPDPPTICKGDSIKLYVQGDYKSVKWSNGSDNWYTYVDPVETKGYLVEVVNKDGCSAKEDIRVTVKNCDTCDVIQELKHKTICKDGDSIIIEGVSGYSSYKWSTGATTRNIVAKKAGWYKLVTKDKNGHECADSVYIHKNERKLKLETVPHPAVICPGETIKIVASDGWKTYYWNTGHREKRIIEIKLEKTKEIVVEAVDENGCDARASIKVIVKDTCDDCPDLIESKTRSLCGKDSIAIEAKPGFKIYEWSNGKKGRLLWVKEKGWYKLTVKDSSGRTCTDSVYVSKGGEKRLAIDIQPSRKICIGDTVIAKATAGFKAYWWNVGSRDRIIEFRAKKRIELVVEAQDSNGCEYRAVRVVEADSCTTGLPEIKNNQIRVYPNPASGVVYVSSPRSPQQIIIYNLLGVEIMKLDHCREVQAIFVKDLDPGHYFIKVDFEDRTITRKLTVER